LYKIKSKESKFNTFEIEVEVEGESEDVCFCFIKAEEGLIMVEIEPRINSIRGSSSG